MWRRPLCGRYGPLVVAGLCSWELAALIPGSPVPLLTTLARKRRVVGVVLVAALTHHFFVESESPCPIRSVAP